MFIVNEWNDMRIDSELLLSLSWILIVQFFEYHCKNPYLPFSCLQIFEIRATLLLQLSWKWDLIGNPVAGDYDPPSGTSVLDHSVTYSPRPIGVTRIGQCEKGTGTKSFSKFIYYNITKGWSSTLSRIYGIANHVGREHTTNKFCIRRTSIGKLKMQMY